MVIGATSCEERARQGRLVGYPLADCSLAGKSRARRRLPGQLRWAG